jgi:hypothetical protein
MGPLTAFSSLGASMGDLSFSQQRHPSAASAESVPARSALRLPYRAGNLRAGFRVRPSRVPVQERDITRPPEHVGPLTDAESPGVSGLTERQGSRLEQPVRGQMERWFGADFTRVRVHTDVAAQRSAEALQAAAYTIGQDIVFGAGKYAPESAAGARLLTHELTHIVQQADANLPHALDGRAHTLPQDQVEREADAVASSAADPMIIRGRLGRSGVARQALASGFRL